MQNVFSLNNSERNCHLFFSKKVSLKYLVTLIRNGKILMSAMFCAYLFSCSPVKNQVYFENLKKDTTLRNVVSGDYEIKIQKSDLLGITVASLSPDVAFYNASQGSSGSSGAAGASSSAGGSSAGYMVDKDGNINFVKIGVLRAEGKTRKELKDTLEKALIPYLKDAIVSVSFLNRHVTMLGAISRQVPLNADNTTLLDALADGGDIGEKGRIDNVLVIREKGNDKQFKRLTLKDNSIFYSPFFYLQPNDIIYVEPRVVKAPLTGTLIISYVATGLSLIFLLINNVFKL